MFLLENSSPCAGRDCLWLLTEGVGSQTWVAFQLQMENWDWPWTCSVTQTLQHVQRCNQCTQQHCCKLPPYSAFLITAQRLANDSFPAPFKACVLSPFSQNYLLLLITPCSPVWDLAQHIVLKGFPVQIHSPGKSSYRNRGNKWIFWKQSEPLLWERKGVRV